MRKVLITGVSSGIGRALAKKLASQGYSVWGVARRKRLLDTLKAEIQSSNFRYSIIDISSQISLKKLTSSLKKAKFYPDIVVLNAAILNGTQKKIFETNFFGPISLVEGLIPTSKRGTEFIAISSSSSLKGSRVEDSGYGPSKAALSIGFENLYQRYKDKGLVFKIVFFGPVEGGMLPFNAKPFILSLDQAVESIIKSIKSSKTLSYYPSWLFFNLRLIKLISQKAYFRGLDIIDKIHEAKLK